MNETIGELVVRHPAAAGVLERLGIDYCCGGRRTLEEACAGRGLDAATVRVLLESVGEEPPADVHDVARASIGELCDHIVSAHHDPTRAQLESIAERVATVVRVHGGEHAELHDLQRLFEGLRAELETHMAREEAELFPACRALADDPAAPVGDALLAELEHDHDATGDALVALRELSGGYREETALCSTHRALLRSLHALERETHQHVHEENNVLFPRVRERLAAA